MYTHLIAAAVAASLAWGAAWHIQTGRINTLKLEAANERIAIQRAARQATEQHQARISTAQAQAAHRAGTLATELGRNRTELERLRIASASSVRAAGSTLDACTSALTAHSVISTQCAAQLTTVATDADTWASHALMLQDAWPK